MQEMQHKHARREYKYNISVTTVLRLGEGAPGGARNDANVFQSIFRV